MGLSKITRNYRITLPKDVRELKGFKVGEKVLFVVEGEKVDLVKVSDDIITKTAGLWARSKETGAEYQRRLRKEWEKRRFSASGRRT
jgi:AbrB family looped-hinge helix DNA binding protein